MRLAAVALAFVLAACQTDSPSAPTGPVDERVVLAPGQLVGVASAGISMRFEGVLGDSRCPANALCVQAGDATVRVVVQSAGGPSSSYDLHTGAPKSVRHGDLTIALENLSPYPLSSQPIAPGDYRATLRITR